MNENLTPNIRAYAAERQLLIAETLGSGKDGIVWVAKRRSGPAKVALKAHRFAELHLREKAVYRRLEQRAINTVRVLNVPELLGFDRLQKRLPYGQCELKRRERAFSPFIADTGGVLS